MRKTAERSLCDWKLPSGVEHEESFRNLIGREGGGKNNNSNSKTTIMIIRIKSSSKFISRGDKNQTTIETNLKFLSLEVLSFTQCDCFVSRARTPSHTRLRGWRRRKCCEDVCGAVRRKFNVTIWCAARHNTVLSRFKQCLWTIC